jgi:hypothetical protein
MGFLVYININCYKQVYPFGMPDLNGASFASAADRTFQEYMLLAVDDAIDTRTEISQTQRDVSAICLMV